MARWRTSAALAALPLVVAACGHVAASESTRVSTGESTSARPQLAPIGQQPLKVKGTGFRPGERVQLAAKGLKGCDSITVAAVGSKGSRTEFNLSQIVCTGT